MDANKSKYSHWRNNTNTTHNSKSRQAFNSRYDPHRYSNKPHLQSISTINNITHRNTNSSLSNTNNINNTNNNNNNKYSVGLNRLLHEQNNKKPSSLSSTTTTTTRETSTNSIPSTQSTTSFPIHNITTRYQKNNNKTTRPSTSSTSSTSVPLSKRMHTTIHSNNNQKNNNNNEYKSNDKIIDKFKNINLSNKFQLSSNNKLLSTKPINTINRITDTQYNLSLIRPSDCVVLYCPVAHCYVCLSDFEEDSDTKEKEEKTTNLYLKCDDMEGVGLLIGETSFTGTCKFLTDCKIQLITGQGGLYKDRNRIIIDSKHATKFMLQKYSNLNDTGCMMIGHNVLIFVEASRSNKKQFWSYNVETESIILKELAQAKPTQNEIFVLQKYGQPLQKYESDDKQDDMQHLNIDLYKLSTNIQEFYLCHDILRVLSRNNFDGDFIKFSYDAVYGFPKVVFNAKKYGIKPLLASSVNALTQLIENTAKVRYFTSIHSRTEYGMVSQAFCCEIDKHLCDFNILIVQLETRLNRNELTLQNMRFYLQRASRSMAALNDICYNIHLNRFHIDKNKNKHENIYRGSRGGALLNMIKDHVEKSGEKHVVILYNKLQKAAQKPYFEMLSNWIYRGIITDIYGEFMIKEKKHLKKEDVGQDYNDEYWTSRYSLNVTQIFKGVNEYKDKIVTTGKYLNVMRESGYRYDINDIDKENGYELIREERELCEIINDRYNFASFALLEMLMNKERIMLRFKSIGKYMLLQCGDWFVHFMDMSNEILIKNASDIKITKLDRLLELSIRTSNSSKNDPFKDDVCCGLRNKDLKQMLQLISILHCNQNGNNNNQNNNKGMMRLTGIQAFQLNYNVLWPSSIIFTGKNLIRYQLIFRFLFQLKYIMRELSQTWKQQMSLRELNLSFFGTHYFKSLMLRHEMLSFLNNLLFYISYQVIEPNWNKFMFFMKNKNRTVDTLLVQQEEFLLRTLDQCLLTNKIRIESLFKILNCCQTFSNFIKRYTSDWKIYQSTHKTQKKNKAAIKMLAKDCRDNLNSSNFTNNIEKYSKLFGEYMKKFLNDLQKSNDENININLLLSRLDFNAYYMPKLLSF